MNRLAYALVFLLITSAAGAAIVSDFDKTNPYPFQFKDDKGSVFNAGPVDAGRERDKVTMIKYNIVDGGYAGFGLPLKNYDASKQEFMSFFIKGEIGGEQFEISMKDKNGLEKKIPTNAYFDVTMDWQKVKIPLSSFVDVRTESIDNISFIFNDIQVSGVIFIDDVGFEGEAEIKQKVTETPEANIKRSNKVLIDGFERVNTNDFYNVKTGNDSSLSLQSSRLLHDGDYSMEMSYYLSNVVNTWVSAVWQSADGLDWNGAEDIKIWIKGDGSDNVFRISLFDAQGNMWSYDDYNAMKSTKWVLLASKISDFKLVSVSNNAPQIPDISAVKGYEIGVWNKTGASSSGKVWVDQFYISGVGLNATLATPPAVVEKLRLAVPSIGNVDLSGVIYSEFMQTPEEAQRMTHWAKLVASAKAGDYSGRFEFASVSQNFSDSVYLKNADDDSGRIVYVAQAPAANFPSIQVMGNNLNFYLTNITIGNIWVEYSKYTFSLPSLGGYGWKGATVEGDIDRFNYHAFYINRPNDSYVLGTRWISYYPDTKLVLYGVHDYASGKVENASRVSNGTLTETNSVDIRSLYRDSVANMELWHWFMDKTIQLEVDAGWDSFEQYAYGVYNVNAPTVWLYSNQYPQTIKLFDPMYRGKIEANELFLPGSILSMEYRFVGTEYKPSFRKEPAWFDDSDADQKGYNIQLTEKYNGFQLFTAYDDLTRLSNNKYFKYRSNFGVGYYGYAGLDVTLSFERTREKYDYASSRSGFVTGFTTGGLRNTIVSKSELYLRNQISSKTAVWFKMFYSEAEDQDTWAKYFFNWLNVRYEYYMSSNAKLFAEYKTSRYPERAWEPAGYPFDDNFTKVSFELTF